MRLITLAPGTSSNVERVGYDRATRVFHVVFNSGSVVYGYPGVSPEEALDILFAPSIGKAVHSRLVSQVKDFTKTPIVAVTDEGVA
jgi:hypothetical protein